MQTGQRSMHLIDIENQLGAGRITAESVTHFFASYRTKLHVGDEDQIVVAVSSTEGLIEIPLSSMSHCRMLCKRGVDGADLALQAVMFTENLPERFDTVVCASGDGGFVEAVAYLTGLGTQVVVVAPAGSISSKLRIAAHSTVELAIEETEKDAA